MEFVVISSKFSGGDRVSTDIRQLETVLCHKNVFSPNGQYFVGNIPSWDMAHRNAEPKLFHDYVLSYPTDKTSVGYNYNFGENPAYEEAVFSVFGTTKVLLIERKDKLQRYVGQKIKELITLGNIEQGGEFAYPDVQISINITEMLADFTADAAKYTDLIQICNDNDIVYKLVSYEDYIANEGSTRAEILTFIGATEEISLPNYYPLYNTRPLSEIILNFGDVSTAVTESPFADDIDLGA